MKKSILSAVFVLSLFASILLGFTSAEAKTVRVKSYFKPSKRGRI